MGRIEREETREEMVCRNRNLNGEESVDPNSLRDALLFTTMCIIGLPVDVHVKDGSIFTGIFHAARVEDDYGTFAAFHRVFDCCESLVFFFLNHFLGFVNLMRLVYGFCELGEVVSWF